MPGEVREAERRCPHERVCLIHVGVGAILPVFCPTDLNRAARTRITLHDQSAWNPTDQGECGSGEPCRTDPNESHPAENRKVGGSIPSLPTTSGQVGPCVVPALSDALAPDSGIVPDHRRHGRPAFAARALASSRGHTDAIEGGHSQAHGQKLRGCPRASQSRSGRRLHGARGRRGFLPRTMAPP